MDNYTENRFGYFRQMTDEDILKVREALKQEIAEYEDDLDNPSIGSAQKSEIRNSDLPYSEQQLEYVESVIKERGLIQTL